MNTKTEKTVKLDDIVNHVNDFLLNSGDELKEARLHMQRLLERILMDKKAYVGFSYLTQKDVEKSMHGTTYGIKVGEKIHSRFVGTDETRVNYSWK